MSLSIGFDIGGTFTDFAMMDQDKGRWVFTKVRTTIPNRSMGCVEGVRALLAEAGRPATTVAYLAHSTTVATNTILERNGAKTGLITTRGFKDVLEIRRQVMPNRYDLRELKPEPLVPRLLRVEVDERVLADGTVEKPVDEEGLRGILERFRREGIQSIAICLLHAYANPANEDQALGAALAADNWYVCASHDVLNEFREYERTSTAVANAYVAPAMQRYLEQLALDLRDEVGVATPLLIFQSNGGVVPATEARARPIASILSGPAAGAMGACAVARQADISDFISLDMGGTSCDVALVKDGRPAFTYGREIGGWPVQAPRLDIHSVGAGGGSIGWIDPGGLLRVGPQSAGADPGPACYGRGGESATVTDANVLLGRLNPGHLLGGRMAIDRALAERAVGRLGQQTGLDSVRAATGVLNVVNSTMVRAIRAVSVERGYDPREFALMPFGGAGPLHACDLAREMGMRQVVVPPHPGLLCAIGLLVSDLRVDGSLTRRLRLNDVSPAELRGIFLKVEQELRETAAVRSLPEAGWRPNYLLDMRYLGQSFELRVPVEPVYLEDGGLELLSAAFDRVHERFYGFAIPRGAKEIVCFRVSLGAPSGVGLGTLPRQEMVDGATELAHRSVFFQEVGWVEQCPVYLRDRLPVGARIQGPAVIEQMDTTTVVAPDFSAEVDEHTNLMLRAC